MKAIVTAFACLVLLAACDSSGGSSNFDGLVFDASSSEGWDSASPLSRSCASTGTDAEELNILVTGLGDRKAYLVLTNGNGQGQVVTASSTYGETVAASSRELRVADAMGRVALRGSETISDYNASPAIPSASARGLSREASSDLPGQVGSTRESFWVLRPTPTNASAQTQLPCTLRAVVDDREGRSGRFVSVYVADEDWEGVVSQAMADALAAKFLVPTATGSPADDIYDLVTDIFGRPWGALPEAAASSFIDGGTEEIVVLIADIDEVAVTDGGMVGYFYARHNQTTQTESNERLMFFVDSRLYAQRDGATWSPEGSWPRDIYATLAHELQHMVNFYERNIVGTGGDETWLNEACSAMAEDFVSRPLALPGPRGVDPLEPGPGEAGNYDGRMPLFDFSPSVPVTDWDNWSSDVLENYSTVYAFAAYLARAYDGASLFRRVVHSAETSGIAQLLDAVAESPSQAGTALAMGSLLRNWGIACIASSVSGAGAYNSGTWSVSAEGGTEYFLGSIDLSRYAYSYATTSGQAVQEGLYYASLPGAGDTFMIYPYSNIFAALESSGGEAGTEILLPPGCIATIVVR